MKEKTGGGKLKLYLFMAVITVVAFICAVVFPFFSVIISRAEESMPFYNLSPKEIVLRSSFSTDYSKSSSERKWNVALATKAIDKTLVDVGAEFSFNNTVGARTEARGYKVAKIIKDGIFVDGVGGGVCQVSTTLYNALLLADLKITESHPHSLRVSYVLPSFDAMVNSGSADLRFVNNTNNPIIIMGVANGNEVSFQIFGESMDCSITRKSVITEKVSPPQTEVIFGSEEDYPALKEFAELYVTFPKDGFKSEGYIVKTLKGKTIERKIRKDFYRPIKGVIVRLLPQPDLPKLDDIEQSI